MCKRDTHNRGHSLGRVRGVTLLSVAVVLEEDVEIARTAAFKIEPRVFEPNHVDILDVPIEGLGAVKRNGMSSIFKLT